MIERYERKAQAFEEALATLTDREMDVIQVEYFDRLNDLGLSSEYFQNTLRSAEDKLCSAICERQILHFQEIRASAEKDRLKRAQEWKHVK